MEWITNPEIWIALITLTALEVVLGIDGGSTTTKGSLVEIKTGRLLDKLYIKTHGNPEASLKRVMKYLSRHKENVVVKGVGTTGSARKLYERILINKKKVDELRRQGVELADRITDEITCDAGHHFKHIRMVVHVGCLAKLVDGPDLEGCTRSDGGVVDVDVTVDRPIGVVRAATQLRRPKCRW